MFDAWVFLAGQLGISLIVLLQLNLYTIMVGASSLGKPDLFHCNELFYLIILSPLFLLYNIYIYTQ